MDLPISLQDITYAENYLAQGDLATATPLLERLVELAEEYIDAECKTEEKRQYFSFDSKFERLAYRRVEKDPRELVQVEVPFDRLYSDMALLHSPAGLCERSQCPDAGCALGPHELQLSLGFGRAVPRTRRQAGMGIALVLGAGACKRWQVRRPRLRQSGSVLLGARDRERFGCRGLRASGAAPGAQRCAYDAPAQQDPYHLSGCRR